MIKKIPKVQSERCPLCGLYSASQSAGSFQLAVLIIYLASWLERFPFVPALNVLF